MARPMPTARSCSEGTGSCKASSPSRPSIWPPPFATDGAFTIGPLVTTKKPCDDPGLEARIIALLDSPQYWSVTGNRLTIYPATISDSGMILRNAG